MHCMAGTKGGYGPWKGGGGTACLTCTHRHREMNERRRARVLAETMRAAAWGADAEHTHTHTEGGGTQGANGKEEEEEEETTWRGDGGAKECSWCACVRWHVMACAASLLAWWKKEQGRWNVGCSVGKRRGHLLWARQRARRGRERQVNNQQCTRDNAQKKEKKKRKKKATSHQPPATSHQPPATSHQPPAKAHASAMHCHTTSNGGKGKACGKRAQRGDMSPGVPDCTERGGGGGKAHSAWVWQQR